MINFVSYNLLHLKHAKQNLSNTLDACLHLILQIASIYQNLDKEMI